MMCNYANTKNCMTTLETSHFMRLVKISSSFVYNFQLDSYLYLAIFCYWTRTVMEVIIRPSPF